MREEEGQKTMVQGKKCIIAKWRCLNNFTVRVYRINTGAVSSIDELDRFPFDCTESYSAVGEDRVVGAEYRRR